MLSILFAGCKKDFLDVRPNKALIVPSTLDDFQALLDDNKDMNQVPYLNVVSTDDIYTTDQGYSGAPTAIKSSYTWEKDLYQGVTVPDWNKPYLQVFYSNVILDGLKVFAADSASRYRSNAIKGSALFFRALAFYHLMQEFAAPYVAATAANTPGIPIRLSADVNIRTDRGTLKESYGQIISDLTQAVTLLPDRVDFATRPTRAAGWALLARVNLVMGDYAAAATAAGSCLALKSDLLDYNSLSPAVARPFPFILPNENQEVLFYDALISVSFLYNPSQTSVDSLLYRSYDDNDLRKSLFFNVNTDGLILFKGTYTGAFSVFAGLATDEVYLIRAEANARLGHIAEAMGDLNALLASRWKTGTFLPLTAVNADDALNKILAERRKELVYRNLRWTDLRRLNLETKFETTVTHKVNGSIYLLKPGDNRYTFPIPDDEIRASGIAQNPR